MANNHYIPRFLAKPWRKPGCPLWSFDFSDQTFSSKLSLDRLFAKRNLWPDAVETFLNKKTENLSEDLRVRLSGQRGIPENWHEYRPLFLLILFQAARSGYAKDLGKDLEVLATISEERLDQLVTLAQKDWSLHGVHLPDSLRFFLTDNGVFMYPFQTLTKVSWMFALPMSGSFCLALIPTDVDSEGLESQIDFQDLVAWSVCSSAKCRKILVHPDLYHFKKNSEVLKNDLLRMRRYVDTQIKLIEFRVNILSK